MSTSPSRPLRFKEFVFQGKNYTAEAVEIAAEAADAMENAIEGFVDSLTTELTTTYKAKIDSLLAAQEEGVKALEEILAKNNQLQKSLEILAEAQTFEPLKKKLGSLANDTEAANQAVKEQIEQARALGKKFADTAGQFAVKIATGGVV